MDYSNTLSSEFSIKPWQVDATIKLIDEGCTIPFIARYRKEVTGSLDDQLLRSLVDRLQYLKNLDKRREEVRSSIEEQGNLTQELTALLLACTSLAEIEDIYRPFKPKRKTRASVAKAKGLQPLAELILFQNPSTNPQDESKQYINEELGVATTDEAIAGAMDIIAEIISGNAEIRKRLRNLFLNTGTLTTHGDDENDTLFKLYHDFSQPVRFIPDHRILAINRGESQDLINVDVSIEEARAVSVCSVLVKNQSDCGKLVLAAAEDAYARLIKPSIEREIRAELSKKAHLSAIELFGHNLRQLLMQPPVQNKVTLGLDPGFRTGCKFAVVDGTGKMLEVGVIYPTKPQEKTLQSEQKVTELINRYNIEIIAIGNGTASRETEIFAANLIKKLDTDVKYMVVSEAGASVYSASKLAANEFPELDVSLRSAVSIARRLQDPLAELVKIDPKSIGVGQYQHDMPEKQLDGSLSGVVEYCVNAVGVDLNTASPTLLANVSGINGTVAQNIVTYRESNGAFNARTGLKAVPKLGAKSYEQCAGFLRIRDGSNFLDNTSVHPESYSAVKKLLAICNIPLKNIDIVLLDEKVAQLGKQYIAESIGIGLPTLNDILSELNKPGRDPRDELPPPMLRGDILSISDLKPGMILDGTIRNVIDFGVFVDIGVHQDGLVHISEISTRHIKHPMEVCKVGDIVKVFIISVDEAKQRISLSIKQTLN